MSKKKKKEKVTIAKTPNPREVNDIMLDTSAGEVLLDTSNYPKTTEAQFSDNEPVGSTRNDLTITFRYNFDKITRLKEIAVAETKATRKNVQYTELMRRAIDETYFGE